MKLSLTEKVQETKFSLFLLSYVYIILRCFRKEKLFLIHIIFTFILHFYFFSFLKIIKKNFFIIILSLKVCKMNINVSHFFITPLKQNFTRISQKLFFKLIYVFTISFTHICLSKKFSTSLKPPF